MPERTFLELQQEVCWNVFGNASTTLPTTNELDQVKRAINHALTEMANLCNMTSLRREGEVPVVTGQTKYELPERCVQIVQHTFWIEGDSTRRLEVMTEQDLVRLGARGSNQTGTPSCIRDLHYDATAKRWMIELFPEPSEDDTLHFQYYETPSELSADGDIPPIPENLHNYLVDGAIATRLATYFSADRQMLQSFLANWGNGIVQARRMKDIVLGRRVQLRPSTPAEDWNLRDPYNFRLLP